MSSKAMRQAAAKGAKRWKQLRFSTLNDVLLPSSLRAELRLPVEVGTASTPTTSSSNSVIRLGLSTNASSVLRQMEKDIDGVFLLSSASSPKKKASEEEDDAEEALAVVAESSLNVHVGAPKDLGFPVALEMESRNWMDGVMRGEQHAYAHFDDVVERDDGSFGRSHPRYVPSTRWLDQLLLDGFVSRRMDGRTGYTTPSVLRAHEQARLFGRQLPPFHLSPYYGANELLSAWCLFAKTTGELFEGGSDSPSSSVATDHHIHRASELALAAAFLPSLQGVWLHGAVLTNSRTGDVVWIAGPRRSGKTTLALHALAAMPELRLTAAETFWMASGVAVQPHWVQPLLFASVPAPVEVGLGAVFGTLHPNPAVAAWVQAHHELPASTQTPQGMMAFLRNSDGRIWDMSLSYPVSLSEALPNPAGSRWSPAVAGRLKAVILLDWDVEALQSTRTAPIVTGRVGRAPLNDPATWAAFRQTFADKRALFKSHYLIRSAYDDSADALWERLETLLHEAETATSQSPELCVMTGAVNFEQAVEAIHTAFRR